MASIISSIPYGCLEPSYHEPPIHCPKLQAYVAVGSFVLFKQYIFQPYCFVGRIVQTLGHERQSVAINIFKPMNSYPWASEARRFPNVIGPNQNLPEVVQSSDLVEVSSSMIDNMCFVFHPDQIQQEGLMCQGIRNCFVCQFRGDKEQISITPFPCTHKNYRKQLPTCHTLDIWNAIGILQDTFARILNRMSEKQGSFACRQSMKLPFHATAFEYIRRSVSEAVRVENCKTVTSHYRINCGLGRTKYTVKRHSQRLRFITECQLERLRNVIGCTTLYGFREPRPNSKQGTLPLRHNDCLNIIVGGQQQNSSHGGPLLKTNDLRTFDHIELKFNGVELYIVVVYHKFLYRTNGQSWEPLVDPYRLAPYPDHLKFLLYFANQHYRQERDATPTTTTGMDSDKENTAIESNTTTTTGASNMLTRAPTKAMLTDDVSISEGDVFEFQPDNTIYEVEKVDTDTILCKSLTSGAKKIFGDLVMVQNAINKYLL